MWPTLPVLFVPLVCYSVNDVFRMVTQEYVGEEVGRISELCELHVNH